MTYDIHVEIVLVHLARFIVNIHSHYNLLVQINMMCNNIEAPIFQYPVY